MPIVISPPDTALNERIPRGIVQVTMGTWRETGNVTVTFNRLCPEYKKWKTCFKPHDDVSNASIRRLLRVVKKLIAEGKVEFRPMMRCSGQEVGWYIWGKGDTNPALWTLGS